MVSHAFNIEKVCRFADVLVGSVLIPGERAPMLVSREMVKSMRSRSIIIDLAIDQGGCIETSRPTTHSNPIYVEEDIIHYCVPNMTGVLGRTATHALNNASWPIVQMVAEIGIEKSFERNPAILRGVYTHRGEIVHQKMQDSLQGRR
jgi:alanine dehydrogenase